MQGSRVRCRECGRVSQRSMGQGRTALPGQRTQGAPTSHHWFLHDEDGAGRASAEVPASRGSDGEGTGASRPVRRPKGHRHRHPDRTYAAVRRRSSYARELIGLAHAGIDRACCDKPVQAAGKREICRRKQSDVVHPRSSLQLYSLHPMPPCSRTGHHALKWREFQMTHCEEETKPISEGWRIWPQRRRRRW